MNERPLTSRMLALLRMFNRCGAMTSDTFHEMKRHCALPHEMPTVQTLYILERRGLIRTQDYWDNRANGYRKIYMFAPKGHNIAKDLGI